MSLISDNFHNKKLKDYGINIKTKYIVGNKILERNTDNSINDDIINGIRCEKQYYLKNKLIHKENLFDSRIEYTFISKELETTNYKCKNCGFESSIKEFENGCPYCRTYYNIDYIDKDLGSKYHYDKVLRSNIYRIVTGIVDLITSIIISYIYIKTTSRTFNNYDISKIVVSSLIISLILYYLFYIIDAYIILTPIKIYKNKQNEKQIKFWNKTKIDKKKFFNNLNYEVRKYYYNKSNVIDYDILDYIKFKNYVKNNINYVEVCADVRIIYFENNKIKSKIVKDNYVMRHNENGVLELNNKVNMIKCQNCGASINAIDKVCKYCHTEIKYLQEWILEC